MLSLAITPRTTQRVVFYSALYDFLVTAPFATPWTASFALHQLAGLHQQLGLHGEAPALVGPVTMLYINFFGTVVLMWAGLRLFQPTAVNGGVDSIGRLFFSLWMAWALHGGASTLIAVFMVLELSWLIVQGSAVWRAWRQQLSPAAATC